VFRATSIAKFAAKYSNPAIGVAASAAYDAIKASAQPIESNFILYTAGDASYAAYALRAAAANSAAYVVADSAGACLAYATAAPFTIASATAATYAAIKNDTQRLYDRARTAEQLARDQLWPISAPAEFAVAWQQLGPELIAMGSHWSVWTDWYENAVLREFNPGITEAEDAAFTDIPGKLPWGVGAEAVNTEIARRLQALRVGGPIEHAVPARLDSEGEKAKTLARLAEVASPQPSLTDEGQLHAGPNQPFDIPTVDDDLSTLPIRQRNLINGILRNLPRNAPSHLKDFLGSYDEELKARGTQPILGLLKDDAAIIAAEVTAPRVEDEWLSPGLRKAFDIWAENHTQLVEHFPLDPKREELYAQTPLDEEQATGKEFTDPFETVAKAARVAHEAGATTDTFLAVIDKMTEFARVVSTQPPASPTNKLSSASPSEIKISPEDRIQPVTTKKRVILGALGFFERTYNLIGSTVTIAGTAGLLEALKPTIEMLSRLLR
jgi:hypothetical protein